MALAAILGAQQSRCGVQIAGLDPVEKQVAFQDKLAAIVKRPHVEDLAVPGRAHVKTCVTRSNHEVLLRWELPVGFNVIAALGKINRLGVPLRRGAETLGGVKGLGPVRIGEERIVLLGTLRTGL